MDSFVTDRSGGFTRNKQKQIYFSFKPAEGEKANWTAVGFSKLRRANRPGGWTIFSLALEG
jgi:hypothetical protein